MNLSSMLTTTTRGSSDTASRSIESSTKALNVPKRILNRQVVHPIFEQCAEYTNDEFWKTKLVFAARDRLPRSFVYRDGFLSHKYKKRTTSVKIPDNNPSETLRIFLGFMNERGIFSDMDTENYKAMVDYAGNSNEITSPEVWTQVGTRLRDNYIEDFIAEIAADMDEQAVSSLRNVIYTGVKLKIFDKTRIKMGHFCIESIDGIIYDNERNLFTIDPDIWRLARNSKLKPGSSINTICSLTSPLKHFRTKTVDYHSIWSKKVDMIGRNANINSRAAPTFMFGSGNSQDYFTGDTMSIPMTESTPTLTII